MLRGPDISLLVGLSACAGALVQAAPFISAITFAVTLGVLWHGGPLRDGFVVRAASTVAVLCASAFSLTSLRATQQMQAFARDHAKVELDGVWPARCDVAGTVARSPSARGDETVLVVEVEQASCPAVPRGRLVMMHVPPEIPLDVGRDDGVRAFVQLAPLHRFWNEELGDPRPGEARRGVVLSGAALDLERTSRARSLARQVDALRAFVRGRIARAFPRETEAMARALMLGENDLSEPDARAFRESGLSHLLAVSGMHLVLVVASFVAALRAVLLRVPALAVRIDVRRLAALIGLPATWFYADFAGGSGSAIRAAWMTSVGLVAVALGRTPNTWRALGLSVLAMVLLDPLAPFDVSFVLSAAATLGLLALGRPLASAMLRHTPSWASILVAPTASTLAATVACAPVLLGMAPELPLAGVAANVVAVPLGETMALPLCLVHALTSWQPTLERGTALAASGALGAVRAVARFFGALDMTKLPLPPPTPFEMGMLAVVVALRVFARWSGRRLMMIGALALVLGEGVARRAGAPRGVLRVTFLDVGQGDAAIVDFPDGRAMVIDAGGFVGSPVDTGERVLAPVLRARRRAEVDVAVLSHPHPDHFGGLRRGLADVRLGAFWDTGQGSEQGAGPAYAELLAWMSRRRVPQKGPSELCGRHFFGGAVVEVLAPCPSFHPDRGANDNSFVLRIRYGHRSVLLVGDAEEDAEHELLKASPELLRADVLKVGHHGSRTSSSPEFVQAVNPEVAVISCGVRNRFGHPHPRTLRTLATHARVQVHRTDREGAVVVTTDGTSLDVQSRSTMPM